MHTQKPGILGILEYSAPSIIASRRIFRTLSYCKNLLIFKILTYLKPSTCSEPSKRFQIEFFFAKIVKKYNYLSRGLHLRSLTGFWIHLFLNKYSSTCRVSSRYVRTLSIILNSDISRHIQVLLRHIQPYCDIFRTLCNSCHFQNSGIFRT